MFLAAFHSFFPQVCKPNFLCSEYSFAPYELLLGRWKEPNAKVAEELGALNILYSI